MQKSYDTYPNCSKNQFSLYVFDFSLTLRSNMIDIQEADDLSFISKEISFLTDSIYCCICIIDIINSTRIASRIKNSANIRKFYSIFINSIASIARGYDAHIIKNFGDSVICYFSNTTNSDDIEEFEKVLKCATAMKSLNKFVNTKMDEELLPHIKYRISIDFGKVEMATSNSSKTCDLFGATVNLCAKINSLAEPNGIAIGGDFYTILKSFPTLERMYQFKYIGEYSTGIKQMYPIYSVNLARNTNNTN